MEKAHFFASMLMACSQASKLVVRQSADDVNPECCRFFTEENFTGNSFDLCMDSVPDPDNSFRLIYKQASRALTDDAQFDDNIKSVKCGVQTSDGPLARVDLCYDHLTIEKDEITSETQFRIQAKCSWTGSEPWESAPGGGIKNEASSVAYPYISSVIVQPANTAQDDGIIKFYDE